MSTASAGRVVLHVAGSCVVNVVAASSSSDGGAFTPKDGGGWWTVNELPLVDGLRARCENAPLEP